MSRLLGFLLLLASPAAVSCGEETPPSAVARAIDRGLKFLAADAVAWNREHQCASCHHAALVAWSMHEARSAGHEIDGTVLKTLMSDMAAAGDGRTSLKRPDGFAKALNTKAVYFAVGLGADSQRNDVANQTLQKMLATVRSDQNSDGSWTAWPETRPPMFGESDSNASAWALLALTFAAPDDRAARLSRERGWDWLPSAPLDDHQTRAMRLILASRLKRPEREWKSLVLQIENTQSMEGGWSQGAGQESDAWATGQALYALSEYHGASRERIRRAEAFLVRSQKENGSWAMSSRPIKPEEPGAANLVPISGGGSAWAVLGLVRSHRVK